MKTQTGDPYFKLCYAHLWA